VEQASLAAGFSPRASIIAPGSASLTDEAASIFCSSIDSSRLTPAWRQKSRQYPAAASFLAQRLVRSAWITSA
jgi:hypothetical protein